MIRRRPEWYFEDNVMRGAHSLAHAALDVGQVRGCVIL